MTFTQTVRKHYGAKNEYVKVGSQEVRLLKYQPLAYLIKHNDGTFEMSDVRPKGKYLCFYSTMARKTFLEKNS